MSGTPPTLPGPGPRPAARSGCDAWPRASSTPTSTARWSARAARSGTPADRDLTADPAAALLELHRAGVPLVLVSGRTLPQVVEAARIFAADGAIAELGALVSWNAGRGDPPAARRAARRATPAATPMAVMAELGVVERLIAAHPGCLEWHAPWHADHTADALLRGRVDIAAVGGASSPRRARAG